MKYLLALFFVTSFVFLLSFLIGWIFVFTGTASKRLKSAYSIFLALCLMVYLLSVVLLFGGALVYKMPDFLPYVVFALIPFLIGKVSTYKSLRLYTFLQISVILTGCISSFLILIAD